MKWYAVEGLPALDEPFMVQVKVAGKAICVVNHNGNLYAVGAYCPHAGATLSGGWCTDGKVICPYHRYSYDLTTGRGSPGQNDYVDTYPIELRNGQVHIGINSFWEKLGL